MIFTPAGKAAMLDSLSGITASLHTADPTNSGGTAELTGGSYARKSIGFAAASGGNRNANSLPTFNVPGGNTITHAALWIGATCIAKGPLANSEAYTGDGTYTLTDADLTLLD